MTDDERRHWEEVIAALPLPSPFISEAHTIPFVDHAPAGGEDEHDEWRRLNLGDER